jgi:RNA-splicing ligase RtcB
MLIKRLPVHERIYELKLEKQTLIGNDVGCGVGLFSTKIKSKKIKRDKWIKKLKDLDQPFDGDLNNWRSAFYLDASLHDVALGTIGGGNHFAELQCIDKVLDDDTYLVKARGDQDKNLWSLPHGAGRKWSRGSCKEKLRDRFQAKSLIKTSIGSHVICEDKNLLYEEAPQAYKNIDTVIADLINADLIGVVAALKPIITYKMRKH